ncbi:Pimeloyl-ACP methyl ester carboxylesterase [Geosmithia morbida]|uniref:Pimeloyl-ACP methyl ester carboxylesterase n=1 Tax=Geosmithia morbida TaxID=1094350 RepID=A0A9P4YTR0_9HYPO|nr:Pimeloyl-ACP methyl ester carboxylesterase [Geosmithia morbida]KAF4121642.1 Pimeloyl-ACP methyl ester carboxylesterase [Geosmithia morbida]
MLASSSLRWICSDAFHVVGYSLGGALAAALVVYYPHMLRSATLVCPGGLIRDAYVGFESRFLYSTQSGWPWLHQRPVRSRSEPSRGPSADVLVVFDEDKNTEVVGFDHVPLSEERDRPTVGDGAAEKNGAEIPPGLPGGKVRIVLADKDPLIDKEEWIEDTSAWRGRR